MSSVHPQQLISPQIFQHLAFVLKESLKAESKLPGLQNLEAVSDVYKKQAFKYREPLDQKEHKQSHSQGKRYKEKSKRNTLENQRTILQDLYKDSLCMEWAGFKLSQNEKKLLSTAMVRTANRYKTSNLRFWGKYLGKSDYYVLQGSSTAVYDDQLKPGQQPRGQGANYLSFWVTTSLLGEWVQLPLITPEQLEGSRLIRVIVSGNLEQKLQFYPRFRGQEKHFLKAQLVRITHACQLFPKGLYKFNEETKSLEFEEEYKQADIAELNSLEQWVHANPYVLKSGRSNHYADPSLSEEKKEALLADLAASDPQQERLKGVAEDKGGEKFGLESLWLGKLIGQTQVYKQQGSGLLGNYSVLTLRNFNWPGFVTCCSNSGFLSFYCGYGLKSGQISFNPSSPNEMQADPQELGEFPEPNPSKQPQPVVQTVQPGKEEDQ